jgi:hypothetical protein
VPREFPAESTCRGALGDGPRGAARGAATAGRGEGGEERERREDLFIASRGMPQAGKVRPKMSTP